MRDPQANQHLPSLPSMLWKAATGVSTIVALLIVVIAPYSETARFVGGGFVVMVVLGVVVYYVGLRNGHRIGLDATNTDVAQE